MSLNRDQILQCEDRLQGEIAERECLLAALKVLKGYAEKGTTLHGVELGLLGRTLLTGGDGKPLLLEPVAEEPAPKAKLPPPVPALPQPKRYIHPELERMVGRNRHGGDTKGVCWAIDRMTADFSLNDIATLLQREGWPVGNAKISVILTRLKNNGRIKELQRGQGRNPAIFQRPEVTAEPTGGAAESIGSGEAPTLAAAA